MNNTSPYGRGRKLISYPRISERSKTPLFGVRQKRSDQKKFKLPLLVTGNGRSGTTWLAKTFAKAGIDCPHEHVGQHGSVSWYFVTDSDWHPYHVSHRPVGRVIHMGERRSDFDFNYTVHLVRDPLKVIGSMSRVMSMTDHWFATSNGMYDQEIYYDRKASRLLKTMHMAYGIWMEAERQSDMRMRLEDVPRKWYTLMTILGMDRKTPMPVIPPTNKSSGIYKARKIYFNDLIREDGLLARKIEDLSRKFGYI